MKKITMIMIMTLFTSLSFAQEIANKEEVHINVNEVLTDNTTLIELEENKKLILNNTESDLDIIKSIPKDAWALIKAPIGWTKKEWIIASGAMTMTTLLMVGDDRVRDFFQSNKSHFSEQVSYFAEKGGSQAPISLAATYLLGTILKNQKLKKASTLAFSSLLISGVLVQGLKQVFSRTRPYAAKNQWEFQGPGKLRGKDNVSFPSGHTAAAFSIAASISTIYDSKLVKILAYSAATLTGLSRIHDNKHWMSDVFMGAIIGTVSGIFITKRHMLNKPNSRVKLAPTIINVNNQTAYGIGVTINLDKKKKKRKPLY